MKSRRPKLTADELIGKKVDVYFNLHKKVFSVRHKGLVHLHTPHLIINNAVFRVSEAGRQRVIKTKQKNVHAYVCGIFNGVPDQTPKVPEQHKTITYNPYLHDAFYYAPVVEVEPPVFDSIHTTANTLILMNKRIYEVI